ncbi:MAG: DUF6979 family protein [Halanaerobiales bacterium]
MRRYGKVAIRAVKLIESIRVNSPREAWNIAAEEILHNKFAIKKSCPKNAFLGLCEEGLVKGISAGDYTRSKKNKRYALAAIKLLRQNNKIEPLKLWKQVIQSLDIGEISHNYQMDVVLGLFEKNLLLISEQNKDKNVM